MDKIEWCVIAFDSTQQALRAEMLLEYADLEIDTFPTPKTITAGCALSIRFPSDELEMVKEIIQSEQVVIRGIFQAAEGNDNSYICIWEQHQEEYK